MIVEIVEPMEFDTDSYYVGVQFPEDGRVWLYGEGEEARLEAQDIVAQAARGDQEAHVVWVQLVVNRA